MQTLSSADLNTPPAGPAENRNRADSAVATIWLVFYILALAVAVTSPMVSDTLTVAAR